jgi:hypothetical protein
MPHPRPLLRRALAMIVTAALAASAILAGSGIAATAIARTAAAPTQASCVLGANGSIRHVIYVQFDNTHLLRDNPNVPSDLEQMPNLLNFMRDNGTLLSNDHTILISHTAGGILSSLTGVYPDRHGQIVSNSNVRFNGTGFQFPSSFGYWTDRVAAGTTIPNMVTPTGANAPAPWVPYTTAGCDFGAVATANTVLENANAVFITGGPTALTTGAAIGDTTILVASVARFQNGTSITIGSGAGAEDGTVASFSTSPSPQITLASPLTKTHAIGSTVYGWTVNLAGDLTKVFGQGSPQWVEGKESQAAASGTAARTLAQTDFVGFAIHCAKDSATCADGQADALPDEPGGYADYKGLFGAQHIDPLLTGSPASVAVKGLDGNDITDPFGQAGFPGFDGMSAAASLAYTAEMQESGVPVTFAYISDAHDNHGTAGNAHIAYGPGSKGYVDQLKAYDDAFGVFFNRLADDGINKSNTLFVFTVDEGDHFAGVEKTNCDGVTTPCVYGPNEVGEINANIDTLLLEQHPELFALDASGKPIFNFTVHGDDAPTFYLSGNPDPTSDRVRDFERATAGLTAVNPYTGNTDHLLAAIADRPEQKLLHMYTTGDANRNPTFTFFADPNYFLTDFPTTTCKTCINPLFAWNHGDIQPEIANTWLGFVGPGIRTLGQTDAVWTDHADVRPTVLVDLGLGTSYENDGRAILEVLYGNATPASLNVRRGLLQQLGAALKQLDAPFGALSMASLKVSTAGIQTGSAGSDSAYTAMDGKLADWLARRDALADHIGQALDQAEFHDQSIGVSQAQGWISQANALIAEVEAAAP